MLGELYLHLAQTRSCVMSATAGVRGRSSIELIPGSYKEILNQAGDCNFQPLVGF